MTGKSITQRSVPEFICTSVRKVEPIGGNCIRIYCSIERNGAWEDRFTVMIPIASALTSAQFVIESAKAIFNEAANTMETTH